MTFKFFKRVACAALAVCTIGAAASMAGCSVETDHPTVQFTIAFNEVDYKVEYKLYRNMYPQTVRHFIELADNGFYDNTIIHNYSANDWYGGGYTYDATHYSVEHAHASYFSTDANSKEQAYVDLFSAGKLTATVFKSGYEHAMTKENALPTLIGEFKSNDHTIKQGELKTQFGALRMYYYKNDSVTKVPILTGQGQKLSRDFKYNCATSIFAMQLGDSSSLSANDYCLFGILNGEENVTKLQNLEDAIVTFANNQHGGTSSFTSKIDVVNVENLATVIEPGTEVSFSVPKTAIVIKSVKVTKY